MPMSGLTGIIPLIYTLPIEGQYPVLPHSESPPGALLGWLQWPRAWHQAKPASLCPEFPQVHGRGQGQWYWLMA